MLESIARCDTDTFTRTGRRNRKHYGDLESTTPEHSGRQADTFRSPPVCAARRHGALRLCGHSPTARNNRGQHAPTHDRVATAGVPSTSAPLETTQASNKAPVYWIGRSNENVFLYREFRDVPEQENPVTRALRSMMSQKPLDPDFFTPWQNPKKLATSISGKNVITVDVSPDAFNSNLDEDMAKRAIQQLVYTATAAGASSGLVDSGQQIQVVILVDGHTDYLAFNHVRLGTPTPRGAGMVAPVWIIDPQEGVGVADGSVKISGRSTLPRGQAPLEDPEGRRQQRQGGLPER